MDSILDSHVNLMPILMIAITSVGLPLATFFAKLAVTEACALVKPYIGEAQALAFQQRVNELIDKGIGEAALHYLPELQAHGLSVDVGNLLAARVLDYAVNHAPDLSDKAKAFEGSLEEKVKARLIVHPAVQAAAASGVLAVPVDLHPALARAA